MSTTYDRLHTAYFPGEYADTLMDVSAIVPDNFLSVKDALYHFRLLNDDQAAEVMEHIADRIDDLDAPWSLRFERGGTEDVAVTGDADPRLRVLHAAPALLSACRMVVARWERGDLAEAARACHTAVALATDSRLPWAIADDPAAEGRPYSVLLLYPDYANDGGSESYYAFVTASDPIEAVALAQRQAVAAQEGIEIEPDDFAPLLVTEGHHYGEPLFNK